MKRINITCPVCGSKAYLRPASVVYGDKAPDPDAKYYVCGRYPACDCYVAAHRKTLLPMGTLADTVTNRARGTSPAATAATVTRATSSGARTPRASA